MTSRVSATDKLNTEEMSYKNLLFSFTLLIHRLSHDLVSNYYMSTSVIGVGKDKPKLKTKTIQLRYPKPKILPILT